ncbi:MAG: zinc-ribbon domain-containing protein, partial [Syntrophomonas sp.]
NIINEALQVAVKQSFQNLGIEMTVFTIASISLPDEIQSILDERTRINMMGGMDNYSRVRTLDVMETAAANEGGGGMMQAGMGLGAGVSMGQVFAQTMGANLQSGGAPIPGGQPGSGVPNAAANAAAAAPGGAVCTNCGQALSAEALFCSKCGTKVAPPAPPATEFKFCSQCGNKLDASASFCSKCGNKL